MNANNEFETVTCRNPKTGQVMNVSQKLFTAVYINKGFELVDRDNADKPGPARKAAPVKARERISQTGSAAVVAERLGLAAPAPAAVNAEKDVTGSETEKNENENDVNTESGIVDDARTPAKRDRGRRS